MSNSHSIHISIGNALPHGNAAESASILSLWQEVQSYFRRRPFKVVLPGARPTHTYSISLDAVFLLTLMEQALQNDGSFDARRQALAENDGRSLAGSLMIEVGTDAEALEEHEAYAVATVFLQQLVLAINLVQPGACRLLQTSFKDDGGHRYEAQVFDSRLYYGAFRNLRDLGWWQRHNPGFDKTWQWLERVDASHSFTAITSLEKVLLTAVKVAEQRNEHSSRTALLIIYQLEMLLDCHAHTDPRHLRNRLRLVLGDFPEAADCIGELYGARDGLLLGSRPVQRPPLICHDSVGEFMEHLDPHNSAVELGTAVVLVLLRELISRNAQGLVFTESVAFSPSQPG